MNFNALENIIMKSYFTLPTTALATLQITAIVFYIYILSYLAEIIACGSVCVYCKHFYF